MRPADISTVEWLLRLELAACYRLFDWMGWAESIYNHITLRIPHADGEPESFLVNPYGLHYCEVTASNLVKVDVDANQAVAGRYGIRGIPTIGLFEGGKLTKQAVGARPRHAIESELGLTRFAVVAKS